MTMAHLLTLQCRASVNYQARDMRTLVQVRLSILFAYMFGKSKLFAQLLRWLAQTSAPIRVALDPLFVTLG